MKYFIHLTGTITSEEHPESKIHDLPEKTETPVKVEYCTSAGPIETRYTTDPSTPLPKGGRWEKTGILEYSYPIWEVKGGRWVLQAAQAGSLYRAILPNSPDGF